MGNASTHYIDEKKCDAAGCVVLRARRGSRRARSGDVGPQRIRLQFYESDPGGRAPQFSHAAISPPIGANPSGMIVGLPNAAADSTRRFGLGHNRMTRRRILLDWLRQIVIQEEQYYVIH